MIQGSVYLVIGGNSSLGKAIVDRLLFKGAKIAFCDNPDGDINIFGDDKIIFLPLNILEDKEVLTVLDMIQQKFGRLDGIINCVDVQANERVYNFQSRKPHDLENFTKIISANTVGPFNVIRLALRLIGKNSPNKNGERGVIVNICVNYSGEAGRCAYIASKAALIGVTLSLDQELRSKRIRVVSIPDGASSNSADSNLTNFFLNQSINERRSCSPRDVANFVTLIIETPSLRSNVCK
ncbi:3-hydroxyacyl-CoA dehydrogenase type-2-like [Cylas formicarius]|uniref:3-hydroxyacyl-CoA dehydrogenase type-2-like n=1 Tax=Cylas formicarius TaxID=197179 RepID=UPI0029589E35|nr:3-hydroxyacyl-CoA dehydrogenase type-2-like [Cylas formicarius]